MSEHSFLIERRFRGPPTSANGGYAAGRLAAFVDGAAEVSLLAPPPLDTPLRVKIVENGDVELHHGERLVATASPATVDLEPIPAPGLAAAADAAGRTFPPEAHGLPTCFVCGPLRDHGDGLRIHVGPIDADDTGWNGVLAAPWVPADEFGDDSGKVRSEFVWAALDCPTAYACGNPEGLISILLGRQAVRIFRRPELGEHCVVAAVARGRERRKHYAEAALFGANGETLASCRAIWIEVSEAVQKGVV
jgi:hypothetical protein